MHRITEIANRFSQNLVSAYQRVIVAIQNSAERIATHQSSTDFQPQFEQYQRLYPNFEDYRCSFESTFSKDLSPNELSTDVLLDNVAVQEFLAQYRISLNAFINERAKMPPISAPAREETNLTANTSTVDKKAEIRAKKQQLFAAKQKLAQHQSELKLLKAKITSVKNQVEELRKMKVQLIMKYDEVQVAKLRVMQFDLEIFALENELEQPNQKNNVN